MRTIILFFAIFIASLLAAFNPHKQNPKEVDRKTGSKFNEKKSTNNEISTKKNRLNIATFYGFYVL